MSTEPHPGPCIDTDHHARLRALSDIGTSEAALAADLREAWARRCRLKDRDLADHGPGTPMGTGTRELDRLRRDIDERHLHRADDDRRVRGCLVTVDPRAGSLVDRRGLQRADGAAREAAAAIRADAGESRDRDALGTPPDGHPSTERGDAS